MPVTVKVPVLVVLPKVAVPAESMLANKLVLDAVVAKKEVVVASAKSAFTKCEVDEAKMPFCAQSTVEVALVLTPKLVVGVNGNAKVVAEVR